MTLLGLALLACTSAEFEDPPEDGVIYVYGGDAVANSSQGSRVTAQVLQGVLNREEPRVFVEINHGEAHDEDWLAAVITGQGLRHRVEDDLLWYLWAWSDELSGYVLFDSQEPATANVAATVAAARGGVPVDVRNARLHSTVADLGLERLADVRTWSDEDLRASGHLSRLDLSGLVLRQPFSGSERLSGDLAAARALPTTWVDPRVDPLLTDYHAWLDLMEAGGVVYGEGFTDALYDQSTWIQPASEAGQEVALTGAANNLSLYGVLDAPQHTAPALPELPDPGRPVHYLSLVVGGGEDVGMLLGRVTHPARGLWAHPDRDSLPLGWSISPMALDLAPGPLLHLLGQASERDGFVSGPGRIDAGLHPDLQSWAPRGLGDLAQLGVGVLALHSADTQALEALLAPEEVRGALLLEGDSALVDGQPAIAVDLLGYEADPDEQIDALAAGLSQRIADPAQLEGYSVVWACARTTSLDDLLALTEALDEHVELVRPDVLVELARRDAR